MHCSAFTSILILAALTGCSSTSSSSATTGSGCSTSAQCGSGLCLRSADFPNGYCSQACDLGNPSSCPAGSACIDDASGAPADAGIHAVCYQTCGSTSDCQAGLACLEKSSKNVCRAGK